MPTDPPPEPPALIAAIASAFANVSREDGLTLHQAEEIDNEWHNADLKAARLLDTDTRWQDVPDEWIESFPSAFHFLDAKGLRYYLPAVMIWHLKPGDSENYPDEAVKRFLHDPERSAELLALLTPEQRHVTALWLQHCAHQMLFDPGAALARLAASPWGNFL